jgi:acetyl-CoA C-acetyltransferase
MTEDAVIVATARTPIGRINGSLNNLDGAELGAIVINAAVERAGLVKDEIYDVIIGTARPEGPQGNNVGRAAALRAGLPVSAGGMTVDRKCASGLQAIALAAQRIRSGEAGIFVAGGLDSCSLALPDTRSDRLVNPWVKEEVPGFYLPMIVTAENVARRYGISRVAQDQFSLESQRRTSIAQQEGRFDAETVPVVATRLMKDKTGTVTGDMVVELSQDEGNRPDTTAEGLAALKVVSGQGGSITAGNSSQLSDGASVCILMSATEAARRGLTPLGVFRDFAVAGCEPDEMGIGPVVVVPKLLERHGLSIDDIDLWELNEAFAVQALYCRDKLGIDPAKFNVDGGAISIGHPFGMSGSRLAGHLLIENGRRAGRFGIVTMCIGGGMGAAALFETG